MAQRACFREEKLHSRPTGRPRGRGCTFASPGPAGSGAALPCPSGFGSARGSVLPTSHRLCRTLRKLRSSFAQGLVCGRVASAFQTPSLGCREPLGSSPGWEGEASSRSPKPGPQPQTPTRGGSQSRPRDPGRGHVNNQYSQKATPMWPWRIDPEQPRLKTLIPFSDGKPVFTCRHAKTTPPPPPDPLCSHTPLFLGQAELLPGSQVPAGMAKTCVSRTWSPRGSLHVNFQSASMTLLRENSPAPKETAKCWKDLEGNVEFNPAIPEESGPLPGNSSGPLSTSCRFFIAIYSIHSALGSANKLAIQRGAPEALDPHTQLWL